MRKEESMHSVKSTVSLRSARHEGQLSVRRRVGLLGEIALNGTV